MKRVCTPEGTMKRENGPGVGQDGVLSHSPVAAAADEDRLRFYRGNSMLGTFRPGVTI